MTNVQEKFVFKDGAYAVVAIAQTDALNQSDVKAAVNILKGMFDADSQDQMTISFRSNRNPKRDAFMATLGFEPNGSNGYRCVSLAALLPEYPATL